MTAHKKKPSLETEFEKTIARLLQTDPKELADALEQAPKKQRDIDRYVKEREESIRKGARRARKRFRP